MLREDGEVDPQLVCCFTARVGKLPPVPRRTMSNVGGNTQVGNPIPRGNDLDDVRAVEEARLHLLKEVRKVIIGQDEVINDLLIALLADGHCLLVGVPGLAKTLLISTLAKALHLTFSRIQFTPDLMPSDITGTEILQEDTTTGRRAFTFIRGPIFANIVLADEINRTPPKTQAALLQAMQEHEVTAGGVTHKLALPFFVLATQNPIEMEGTYPLPEAQLDRFMMNILVDYPDEPEEVEIVERTTSGIVTDLQPVLSAEDVIRFQRLVRRVPVATHVVEYAVRLVRSSRPQRDTSPGKDQTGDTNRKGLSTQSVSDILRWIAWGAGPRASQYLILGAKTRAVLDGRFTPTIDDVRSVARPVLRHRIVRNYAAEAEGIDAVDIIDHLLQHVPAGAEAHT
jgi:MoxR-like ATPase